jgi:hypothetical protein
MRAGRKACTCQSCAVVCKGKFNGCPEVWAAGPRTIEPSAPSRLALSNGAAPVVSTKTIAVKPHAVSHVRAVPDDTEAAIASLRHDVEGVHLDLSDVVASLKGLSDSVRDEARELRESNDELRRELGMLAELAGQQQALLSQIAEAQATPPDSRSSLERILHDRRARSHSKGAEQADGAPSLRAVPSQNSERGLTNGIVPDANWENPGVAGNGELHQ